MKNIRNLAAATMITAASGATAAPQQKHQPSPEDARLIAQTKAELTPSKIDPGKTAGYQQVVKKAPWLARTAPGIALIGDLNRDPTGRGTAALIDTYGTMITAAHVATSETVTFNFWGWSS